MYQLESVADKLGKFLSESVSGMEELNARIVSSQMYQYMMYLNTLGNELKIGYYQRQLKFQLKSSWSIKGLSRMEAVKVIAGSLSQDFGVELDGKNMNPEEILEE